MVAPRKIGQRSDGSAELTFHDNQGFIETRYAIPCRCSREVRNQIGQSHIELADRSVNAVSNRFYLPTLLIFIVSMRRL
jgi:hypothetical protein